MRPLDRWDWLVALAALAVVALTLALDRPFVADDGRTGAQRAPAADPPAAGTTSTTAPERR